MSATNETTTPERLTLPDREALREARLVFAVLDGEDDDGNRIRAEDRHGYTIEAALDVVEYLGREDVQEALRAMAAHFEGGWRVPGHPYAALVRPLLYDREEETDG